MNQPIISIKDLRKTFKVGQRKEHGLFNAMKALVVHKHTMVKAVDGISLDVQEGDVYGFIGPNGAGKSTTIKMISGVLTPTSGEVTILDYVPWKDRLAYVKNIGVVFGQKSQLWWDLPPIDTFHLNKVIYQIPDRAFKDNVDFFTEVLNLADILSKPVRQLSLGERMKCEFVCAMLHNPRIVFLDEPTIGLDVISKDVVRDFIRTVNRERNTTFIVTTHDLNDIEDLCRNLCIINSGRIVYDGELKFLKQFSSKKQIEINTTSPINTIDMPGVSVVEQSDYKAVLEIDTKEHDLKEFIAHVFGITGIHDINVNSISIEKVIKEIYQQG